MNLLMLAFFLFSFLVPLEWAHLSPFKNPIGQIVILIIKITFDLSFEQMKK